MLLLRNVGQLCARASSSLLCFHPLNARVRGTPVASPIFAGSQTDRRSLTAGYLRQASGREQHPVINGFLLLTSAFRRPFGRSPHRAFPFQTIADSGNFTCITSALIVPRVRCQREKRRASSRWLGRHGLLLVLKINNARLRRITLHVWSCKVHRFGIIAFSWGNGN